MIGDLLEERDQCVYLVELGVQ